MLSLPAKARALLYLSHVWRVIKSSVPGGGPTGEKQMHDRESCHSPEGDESLQRQRPLF